MKSYSTKVHHWQAKNGHYLALLNWVETTVRKEYLMVARSRINSADADVSYTKTVATVFTTMTATSEGATPVRPAEGVDKPPKKTNTL